MPHLDLGISNLYNSHICFEWCQFFFVQTSIIYARDIDRLGGREVLLRNPNPHLPQDYNKTIENSEQLGQRALLGIEPNTFHQPALKPESRSRWCGRMKYKINIIRLKK